MKAPGLGALGSGLVMQQMGRPGAQRNPFPLPSMDGVVEDQGLLVGLGQGEGASLCFGRRAMAKLGLGRGSRSRGYRADRQGEVLLAGSPFTSTTGGLQLSEMGTSLAVPALARSL